MDPNKPSPTQPSSQSSTRGATTTATTARPVVAPPAPTAAAVSSSSLSATGTSADQRLHPNVHELVKPMFIKMRSCVGITVYQSQSIQRGEFPTCIGIRRTIDVPVKFQLVNPDLKNGKSRSGQPVNSMFGFGASKSTMSHDGYLEIAIQGSVFLVPKSTQKKLQTSPSAVTSMPVAEESKQSGTGSQSSTSSNVSNSVNVQANSLTVSSSKITTLEEPLSDRMWKVHERHMKLLGKMQIVAQKQYTRVSDPEYVDKTSKKMNNAHERVQKKWVEAIYSLSKEYSDWWP